MKRYLLPLGWLRRPGGGSERAENDVTRIK